MTTSGESLRQGAVGKEVAKEVVFFAINLWQRMPQQCKQDNQCGEQRSTQ